MRWLRKLRSRHRMRGGRMGAGDLVIYLADPLRFGGELLIVQVIADGRLLCEAVFYDVEDDDATPIRALLEPHQVELASRWAHA